MKIDLSTSWMGIPLTHPIVPGASPLSLDLDAAKRLEDAGAPLLVMHSLFEEQVVGEELATRVAYDLHAESFAEATSYLPDPDLFSLGPEEYLEQLGKLKRALNIPIIASLNGITQGGWLDYAALIEQAGADGIELNVYDVVMNPERDGRSIEREVIELVQALTMRTDVPIAVKLSPFYSSLPWFARQLVHAGAAGLVLFNRFFEPDIDPENLELQRHLAPSGHGELALRLRWTGILRDTVPCGLAVTGGVRNGRDVVKSVMAGADTVQVVSSLLGQGPDRITSMLMEMADWMEEHEYESLAVMRGSMSLNRCPKPMAYSRANYVKMITGWDAGLFKS